VERSEAEAIYGQGREAVVAVLLRLDAQIAALSERIAKQEERIAQLERQAKRSRNSSQPPSADPPGTPPRRGKDPSGRQPGGQPGHEGQAASTDRRDALARQTRARGAPQPQSGRGAPTTRPRRARSATSTPERPTG
jgi:transposase